MVIILLLILFASPVIALEPPPQWMIDMPAGTPETYYWPGLWQPPNSSGFFRLGYWPQDSFVISWVAYNSEPEIGYPYHYGTVRGISDTVKVRVYFDNRSPTDFYIGDKSPAGWFYPELYDPSADVFKPGPLADTSAFGFRFEHWIDMTDGVIASKPDTIRSRALHKPVYPRGMIFSLWGVGPGRYRVALKPTAALPTGVKLALDNPSNVFTIITPQHVRDTLNAWCMIASNALLRREFTLFNTYLGNVMARNPKSIPGWALRYSGYAAQGDTVNAIAALDSLLHIGSNNHDPMVPDSSARTEVWNAWLQDYLHNYPFARWRLRYPETKYIVFF